MCTDRARIAIAVAFVAALAAPVEAQEAPTAEELFREGAALLSDGRYEAARAVLERAFELEPRASTAFNLAAALQALGHSSDAMRLLARVEALELGPLPEGSEEALRTLRTSIEANLATVELRAIRPALVEILLDDELAGEVAAGASLRRELDPGTHRLRARAPDHVELVRELVLDPGRTERVDLALEPLRVEPVAPPPIAHDDLEDEESGPGLAIALLIGGAAVLAISAIVTVLLLTAGPRFECDELIGCTDT